MKMKLWDRIQRGMDEGFDAAIATVYAITEKAGEGIELTRLRREKTRLETQVTRRLAELGNVVYEKIAVTEDQVPEGYKLDDFREVGADSKSNTVCRVDHVREHLVLVEYD